MDQRDPDDRLLAIDALVGLSAADLPYRESYLDRAGELLQPILTEDQFLALRRDRDSLPVVTQTLRRGAERGDWERVRELAHRVAIDRRRVAANHRLLVLGEIVYGPRDFVVEPTALALSGLIVQPTSNLGRARDECIERLEFLIANDAQHTPRYRERLAHFQKLEVVADEDARTVLTGDHLQRRIVEAVDLGDFEQVERLSAAILDQAPENAPARFRAPRPGASVAQSLTTAFPEAALRQSHALGLEAVSLAADGALNGYLSCCCVERLSFPSAPLTEANRKPGACTCGHACPPTVSAGLRQNLDLLLLHPFVTSVGTRYLPWFGAETLLVETFPETQPNCRTGLLDALGLTSRRGVSRRVVERAIRRHGRSLCARLELDPALYAIICVPFDAYLRLASTFEWGRRHMWTHFDGYQVTRELHTRALVGGDATYGGPEDLCTVGDDYDSERLIARFAIVQRGRFSAREPP